jgi:hypothetical protein
MSIRLSPDESQPSVAIEIPLERPLPDYDLDKLEQPAPHDVDVILVSQGFRDLVDDTFGVLTDLLSNSGLEITQLTGAISPCGSDVYRPGLWIVLRDTQAAPRQPLPPARQERVAAIAAELVTRLQLA